MLPLEWRHVDWHGRSVRLDAHTTKNDEGRVERAGVPRSVAMSIVEHKTESIYRRSAIVDEATQRQAASRLDERRACLRVVAAEPSTTASKRDQC